MQKLKKNVRTNVSKHYEIMQSPFYKLSTKRRLAALLDFSLKELCLFIKAIGSYYSEYNYQKRALVDHPLFAIKSRKIQQQKSELERVHRKIYKYLDRMAVPVYLHSAIKGKSYETNASVHKDADIVYKLDIKSFYPSIKEKTVRRFFVDTMLCPGDVADALAQICCFNKIIPTGSCLSPILSFWVNKDMFDELYYLGLMNNTNMTLYVDDIVFSGEKITRSMMYEIDCIVKKYGYIPHKKKLYKKSQAKIVTGMAIVNNELEIPHKRRAKIRILVKALQNENRQRKKDKLSDSLWGMVSGVKRIDPDLALYGACSVSNLSIQHKKRFVTLINNCSN